ncbi:hypothetical protein VTI74DRAFT_10335 [Chaetomium olivicolor]
MPGNQARTAAVRAFCCLKTLGSKLGPRAELPDQIGRDASVGPNTQIRQWECAGYVDWGAHMPPFPSWVAESSPAAATGWQTERPVERVPIGKSRESRWPESAESPCCCRPSVAVTVDLLPRIRPVLTRPDAREGDSSPAQRAPWMFGTDTQPRNLVPWLGPPLNAQGTSGRRAFKLS